MDQPTAYGMRTCSGGLSLMADHHPWSGRVISSTFIVAVTSGVLVNNLGVLHLSSCNSARPELAALTVRDQTAQILPIDGGHPQSVTPQLPAVDLGEASSNIQIQNTLLKETPNRPLLIAVAPGSFWMGSNPQERGNCELCQDEILHKVRIDYSFYVAESETTQAQFENIMGHNPMPEEFQAPNKPVGNISLFDALKYCNKLSMIEGLELCYSDIDSGATWPKLLKCRGYRLPTEAEWEYVARGGQWNLYAGSNDPNQVAWYNRSDAGPEPVKTKQPNAWKLYDLSGNVAEWVWDFHGPYITGEPEIVNPIQTNPSQHNAALTVIRGGAWYDQAFRVRAANRQGYELDSVAAGHGFRIVRSNL